VPRWRRRKLPPGPVITVQGRGARKLTRDLRAQARAQAAAVQPQQPARPHAFRFRYHLIPFWWLAWLLAAGLGTYALRSPQLGVVAGLASAAAIILLTRHLGKFAHRAALAMGALTAGLLPALAFTGPRPALPVTLACWACVVVPWVKHYRWRPQEPPPPPETTDYDRWNALAAEKRWNGWLGTAEALPGGGRRYPVQLDGIKTTIGNVTGASENVAGAWHKPMTEAYAERDPAGITSRGYLTILGRDTLMRVREWDGTGIDPATGTAVIGRYADGSPVRLKFYTPRYGTRHALISGTTGSGKTQLLDLLIHIALTSGIFVPIVLDPQEGQSLPYWRGRCMYAAGEDECRKMLHGLHAGMMDRSRYLARLRWDDDGIPMRGMPFFDHELTGLLMPLIIFDEAHIPLTANTKASRGTAQSMGTVQATVEIARLSRKTGIALWLATHIPSLTDLGGEQALRDMLRGGNVACLRTANRVGAGMVGLQKDPSEIPMFFVDGRETYGLGYVAGPDNRPDAPMRVDLLPKTARRKDPLVPRLDDRFLEAMDVAMGRQVA
jgi:hypothetical protein